MNVHVPIDMHSYVLYFLWLQAGEAEAEDGVLLMVTAGDDGGEDEFETIEPL